MSIDELVREYAARESSEIEWLLRDALERFFGGPLTKLQLAIVKGRAHVNIHSDGARYYYVDDMLILETRRIEGELCYKFGPIRSPQPPAAAHAPTNS